MRGCTISTSPDTDELTKTTAVWLRGLFYIAWATGMVGWSENREEALLKAEGSKPVVKWRAGKIRSKMK